MQRETGKGADEKIKQNWRLGLAKERGKGRESRREMARR
jgi:hypothetical protein